MNNARFCRVWGGLFMGNPWIRVYLQHSYSSAFNDLKYLGRSPDYLKKDFSCWLCGVAGPKTAQNYLDFVFTKNPNSKVTILDLGDYQIREIEKLISRRKYQNKLIKLICADALDAEKYIKPKSVDWIDTDNIMMFFDDEKLKKLFRVWRNILKDNGWITFRENARSGKIGSFVDWIMVIGGKIIFDAQLFAHSADELRRIITDSNFQYYERYSLLPMVKRFCMIKSGNSLK